MYLVIDTTEDEKITLYYTEGSEWKLFCFAANREGSLLLAIDQMLTSINKKPEDLEGVAARVGTGRFTATRMATTVANTLAYSLHIPVVASAVLELDHIRQQLENTPLGQYATALYSAPASVGKKS